MSLIELLIKRFAHSALEFSDLREKHWVDLVAGGLEEELLVGFECHIPKKKFQTQLRSSLTEHG